MAPSGHPFVDDGSALSCPACSGTNVSLEQAFVSARQEDQAADEVVVHAVTGQVDVGGRGAAPAGSIVGTGRRHRIALAGYCEDCRAPLALVFTQHKGQTLVEWSQDATWFNGDEDGSNQAF